jgi:hypothetical protein
VTTQTGASPASLTWQRYLTAAVVLVAPLIGIIVLLLIFQPFADAAGGCGGG